MYLPSSATSAELAIVLSNLGYRLVIQGAPRRRSFCATRH